MNSPMQPVRYSIVPKNPAAHMFEVSLTVAEPDPAGQRFLLLVWIPGSYMIRELARNIVTLQAFIQCGGAAREHRKDRPACVADRAGQRSDHAALRGLRVGYVGARRPFR